LRVDSGVEDHSVISVHYDPMLAKVAVWAPTRTEAALALARALSRASIHGSITNRDLLVRVLRHPAFLAGTTDTHFLERHDLTTLSAGLVDGDELEAAALAAALAAQANRIASRTALGTIPSGWRNNPTGMQTTTYSTGHGSAATTFEVGYRFDRTGRIRASIGERKMADLVLRHCDPSRVGLEIAGHLRWFDVHRVDNRHHVDGPSGSITLIEAARFPVTEHAEEPGSLNAPMPGRVLQVNVEEGATVAEGDAVVVLEAMKMEHTLRAPFDGTVATVRVAPGDQVEADEVLVVVEAASTAEPGTD
jgi:propionyl-CoA carboxylase alpha chain